MLLLVEMTIVVGSNQRIKMRLKKWKRSPFILPYGNKLKKSRARKIEKKVNKVGDRTRTGMPFWSSITGLDSEVSEEGKMKELAKDWVKHIPQFIEDVAETQWSSSGLPMGMSQWERESLHFSVTGGGNLNSPSIKSGWEPLTKVENIQDTTTPSHPPDLTMF